MLPVPLVVAHRGACAYRPEHTLPAYELAIELGADFIEPDLVATQDGVLVARHENEIGRTTDVQQHPEFADRHVTKFIDGRRVSGWFTEDFTLAELRTLRATERVPQLRPHNSAYDALFQVPTLDEIIELAKRTRVGLYPETKHPTYFETIGLGLEEPLVEALESAGFHGRAARVLIQSFETGNLRKLRERTEPPLVQLVHHDGQPYDLQAVGDPRTYRDLARPDGLAEIARYASVVGASKELVVTPEPDEPRGPRGASSPTPTRPDAASTPTRSAPSSSSCPRTCATPPTPRRSCVGSSSLASTGSSPIIRTPPSPLASSSGAPSPPCPSRRAGPRRAWTPTSRAGAGRWRAQPSSRRPGTPTASSGPSGSRSPSCRGTARS